MKIRKKFQSIAAIFIFILLISGAVIYWQVSKIVDSNIDQQLQKITNLTLKNLKTTIKTSIVNYLRGITEKNLEIIKSIYQDYKNGKISEAQAKRTATKILHSQTIGKTGYFYVIDSMGICQVHKVPKLIGFDISKLNFGKKQIEKKVGYQEYQWKNPGDKKARAKVVYWNYFKEWDWIISTSAYKDDFRFLIKPYDIKKDILSIKIGKTGYITIFDTKGKMIIHPKIKFGSDVYHMKDSKGKLIFKDMIEQQNGKISYWWKNLGEKKSKKKFAYFRLYPELGWIVMSTSYIEEFLQSKNNITKIIIFTVIITLFLIFPLVIFTGFSISKPIDKLMFLSKKVAQKNFDIYADLKTKDEFEDLAETFNLMAKTIKDYTENLEKEIEREKAEVILLKKELSIIRTETGFKQIITQDQKILEILKVIKSIAKTNATVLILGESGTGKELIAKAIHEKSNRSSNPFIAINCAAIPAELLESELFGYEKGAFTGAYSLRKGKFEEANGGTLFLDEIGEMKIELQAKLLTVIEEKKIERIGSNKKVSLDIRIVCATNKNLEELAKENKFRNDLYYRLNVVSINLPPLRNRKEDIKLLIFHFLKKYSDENDKKALNISKNTLNILVAYLWPGNIRELENLIYSIVITKNDDSDVIEVKDIPEKILSKSIVSKDMIEKEGFSFPLNLKMYIDSYEKNIIKEAYGKSDKNQNKTARNLKMSLSGLQYKLKKYCIK